MTAEPPPGFRTAEQLDDTELATTFANVQRHAFAVSAAAMLENAKAARWFGVSGAFSALATGLQIGGLIAAGDGVPVVVLLGVGALGGALLALGAGRWHWRRAHAEIAAGEGYARAMEQLGPAMKRRGLLARVAAPVSLTAAAYDAEHG